jgi:bifunctional ADP-heptose synthase (sugar kinase/adenylyltransferase)
VIATLSLLAGCDAPLPLSCFLANIAAGIEVGKRGTATVKIGEMRAFLKDHLLENEE